MHSIKFRLIFYFMVLIIFPVLIIASLTQIISNNIISNKIEESITNNINQLKVNVDDVLENSKSILNVFILNDNFKSLLRKHMHVDEANDYAQISSMLELLSGLVKSSKDIDSIYIWDKNDNILITSSGNVIEDSDFSSSPVYREAVLKGRMDEWIPNSQNSFIYKLSSDYFLTYVMPIRIYSEGLDVGYAFINIKEKAIFRYLDIVTFNGSGNIMVVNDKGEILSLSDKSSQEVSMAFYSDYKILLSESADRFPLKINKGNILAFLKRSETSALYYLAFVPVSNINMEISMLRNVIIVVCVLTIAFAIIVSTFFTKSIFVPINRLVAAMEQLVFEPNFDYYIKEKRKDEFGILYNHFNKMVIGMKQLFEQLFDEKLRKEKAQLKLLQAQINPHFLYNTLNSIYYISKLHNVNEITELSYSLANFFRISLSDGLEFITVREMLDQINYYLRIQNIRYKDQFELITDVDQELLDYPVLKFILQPLVENSIIHGMKNKNEKGVIDITGYVVNENVKFTVKDNGLGISQEGLEKIQKTLSQTTDEIEVRDMFALRNIHRRIRLHYGEQYGLRIFSSDGEGTVVEVILPFIGKEDDANV